MSEVKLEKKDKTKTWHFSVLEAFEAMDRSQMPSEKSTLAMYMKWEAQEGIAGFWFVD